MHSIFELNRGMPDPGILSLSMEMSWPIVTNDKDFGELVFRRGLLAFGVMLLRFPSYVPTLEKADVFLTWLESNGHLLAGHYVVMTPTSARVRSLNTA